MSREPAITERLRWVGDLDEDSPTLGLPVLEGVRKAILYRPGAGDDTYSHHAYVAFHRGVLYVIWSNHARDEDASGQHVRFRSSSDGGLTWQPPAVLFPGHDCVRIHAEMDTSRDRILIANGFARVSDTLYAVVEAHVLDQQRGFGRLARAIGGERGPGEIFWLVNTPPSPIPGFPTYPDGGGPAFAETAAAINAWLAQPEHWPSWEFLHHTDALLSDDGRQLCEPTTAWRCAGGGRLRIWRDLSGESRSQYVQRSDDGGVTWQTPTRASFPDAYSRTAAGNLPDGTAFIINNPAHKRRDPLVISLAADGVNFDQHAVIAHSAPSRRFEGRCKNLGFQYPYATTVGETLWVAYSVNKEDIEVVEVPLNALTTMMRAGEVSHPPRRKGSP